MKTEYSKDFYIKLKLAVSVLFLFFSFTAQAQEDEEDNEKQDTLTGYNTGRVELDNPKSIVEAYTYDPVTDRYIYTEDFEGFNITYPIILTPEEYNELVLRESMREYYQQKSKALDGKGTEEEQKDLLPRYYVNSKFFETVFGGNTIDIKPQGSVELDLGVRYTKQDNPSLSPRNRKTFTFDFDQRISMSLQGKVGTRLGVTANYDTESTFAFQNLIKLEYTPDEDDIIQKIEVGNVSFPLSNSLVRGAQSLFGVKAMFQFGKTSITGIYSEQKSQTKTITAQGGDLVQDFSFFALEYEQDKHFFLSQWFRNNYDRSLEQYPLITSRVQITRVEVWVTNRQNRINAQENNSRNLIAIQDLGESQLTSTYDGSDITDQAVGFADVVNPGQFFLQPVNSYPDNGNNGLDPALVGNGSLYLDPNIREIVTLSNNSFTNGLNANEGRDYAKLENARKLTSNEFSFHPQLGYISLNQKLNNDEVLAVAFQFTVGSDVYQVGEFATDSADATTVTESGNPDEQPAVSTKSLILKLLKSSLVNVNEPTWDLMMKNIYQIPGGYQLTQEDFRFNILYTDPSPLNYITPATDAGGNIIDPFPVDEEVAETPLLRVFNLDRLSYANDPQPGGDGFFDFYPGITIDPQNGRLIFTTVEPFGRHLFEKLRLENTENYNETGGTSSFNANQQKYVFRRMYNSTQADASQEAEKNKFQLRGKFKSSGGGGIPLGAFNVPQGSVVVTAGGRVLVEGVDYTVNYQLGRVDILDPSLLNSNQQIEVSLENNAVFGQQTRRFAGFYLEHKFTDKFLVGASMLNMSERPFTTKSNYGQESVNNTIFGLNTTYSTEVPFFTRLVNKLPNVDTDVPSNLSVRAEVAYLQPGASKADQFNNEPTTYVDDFEGSQTTIDMRSPQAWSLSSAPLTVFPGNAPPVDDLSYGYQRGKLAWYTIDPTFFTNQRPSGINDDDLSSNRTRRVYYNELYPVTDIAPGQTTVVNTLDLSYFPQERGPYNYNPAAAATDSFTELQAEDNWAGIMRAITSTNFEQNNVEYIQFWVMDPYSGHDGDFADPDNIGFLEINLGEISEDILKDNRKQYENGLPGVDDNQPTFTSNWSKVPVSQSLIYAFDTDTANRALQDVGLDGLTDAEEAAKYAAQGYGGYVDPAADNYQFFLDADGDVINRYKNYNGVQGNSPVDVTNNTRGSTTMPDTEDINRDNTMNTIDAYYRYRIPIEPNVQPGQGYVVDARTFTVDVPGNNGTNAETTATGRWLQYKIPVQVPDDTDPEYAVGGISSTRSIRFMRMFVTGFKREITLRFGALDLVRGEWRRYTGQFDKNTDPDGNPADPGTGFDVVSLSVQENGQRSPIPYVSPPGVVREQLYTSSAVINQNEQALSLRVYSNQGAGTDDGLEPGDSRAVFKNVNVDMRQFKKIRMFLHAEQLTLDGTNPESGAVQNGEMKAFIRFGNDFTDNYYQIETILDMTPLTSVLPEDVWLEQNEINLPLEILTQIKILAYQGALPIDDEGASYANVNDLDASLGDRMTVRIKGNPNFGLVRTLMVGVKNGYNVGEPGARKLRGEVWFNELRLSDMDSKGGMAGLANMDTNFADFATLSATGRVSTVGFGSIEQGPNERSREDAKQYNIVTNVNVGKLLPKKWGINLPFNYGVGEEIITPEYDPYQQDVKLDQMIDLAETQEEKDNIRDRAIDYTKTKSINFIGVKKERSPEQKPHIYDPENITLSYSYNQIDHHDYEIESMLDQRVRTSADYNYSFSAKPVEPFAKNKMMSKSQYWKILRDFNFNYVPSNISFSTNILRQFNRQEFRNVDVEGIPINPLYRRNYFFDYQYGFNYILSKGLKFNYRAATSNIVRNYLDEDGAPIEELTVWDGFWDPGTANTHMQQLTMNYDLPINKIPFLSFVKSTYTYTSTFNWQRSNDALRYYTPPDENITYDLGNTIQNSAEHKLNTALSMDMFYKYIGLTNKKPAKNAKPQAPKPGQKITSNEKAGSDGNMFVNGLIGVVTSVKTIGIDYRQNEGTLLPGYTEGIGFFGTSKPGIDYIFGGQGNIAAQMGADGYLTTYRDYNQNFTRTRTEVLRMTAAINLFPDLNIDLNADRSYSRNSSEQYFVDLDSGSPVYTPESPYDMGMMQMTTILIKTAFSRSDVNGSEAFDQMRENRIIVANRLAEQHYGSGGIPRYNVPGEDINAGSDYSIANAGYPVGYGKNTQAVLLPAFLAAYSGQDAGNVKTSPFRDVPLPNWIVKYTGLMRYKYFKERFKRFSLQHGYTAKYNISSYRTNLEYSSNNPDGADANGDFINQIIISNVNLTEQFNPLIRIDMEMKNSIKILAEIKKDRTLNMSFDNSLLTEVRGNEYTLGLGYRIKDVTITSSLADNPTNVIKSDINLKGDFTLRKNETIVRYLDYDNNQLGGGQNIWSFKFTADYSFSKNLTAIFYYDHSFSKAVISTAYPLTNIRSGFTLRYNFGNN